MKKKNNVQTVHKRKTTSYLKLPTALVEDVRKLNLSKDYQSYCFKFIGIIQRNNFIDYKDLFEETAIPVEYIKKSFNDNKYLNWLQPLLDSGIVIRSNYYSDITNTCYNYSINNLYYNHNNIDIILCGDNHSKPLSIVAFRDIIKESKEDNLYLNYFKNDIESLTIDYSKLEEIIERRINEITIDAFAMNEDILDESFYLTLNKSGMWIKRSDAIQKAKEMKMNLIKDGKRFVIEQPDSFISKKKEMIRIMYGEALLNLQNGNLRAKRNDTNRRLDTNFTNMCSELVDEICNQNDLIQIDLKNSQFAILSLMLQDKLNTPDFKLFKSLTASGNLYEYIQDKLALNTRKEGKNVAFEILFSSHKNRTKNKTKLKELFPSVIEFIDNYKKENGDAMFAIKMQRKESTMFIDNIYNQLKKKKLFALTKHDSLIVKEENKVEVIKLIEAYFEGLNFDYSIDIKEPIKVAEIEENNKEISIDEYERRMIIKYGSYLDMVKFGMVIGIMKNHFKSLDDVTEEFKNQSFCNFKINNQLVNILR